MTELTREISDGDSTALFEAFRGTPWERRGVEHFERLHLQHREGSRVVLVGVIGSVPVGHVSLVWNSDYPPFREVGIPEIRDLTVRPATRRRGVASRLLERTEQIAGGRSSRVGIGVGLHSGYGAAQRLYVQRGYIPDGHGLIRHGKVVDEGERVTLDDDAVLYLTKVLGGSHTG